MRQSKRGAAQNEASSLCWPRQVTVCYSEEEAAAGVGGTRAQASRGAAAIREQGQADHMLCLQQKLSTAIESLTQRGGEAVERGNQHTCLQTVDKLIGRRQ